MSVEIHSSQFPANVRQDLLESLRTRRVNHKFHYDSIKQTQKWLALHAAYSPSRTDPDCATIYNHGFAAAARAVPGRVHLFGLGCGGGQKDTRLLTLLREQGKSVCYTPSDVSVAMVLVAQQTATNVATGADVRPLVCDLAAADDLPTVVQSRPNDSSCRLVTFFGMIPNFEPRQILSRLAALVRDGDWLLFSANLAPGTDYHEGVRRVLPLYDNDLTREWLLTFLLDLGVERKDGSLRFSIEEDKDGLRRITATFEFSQPRQVSVEDETFQFAVGDRIRLFYSYRHTPGTVAELLNGVGIRVVNQWTTPSQEEGVFFCRRG